MHKAVKLGLGILLFTTAVFAQPSAPEAPSLPETTTEPKTETTTAATEAVNSQSQSIVRTEAVPPGDFTRPSAPEATEISPAPHASPYD